ncbi:MAG: BadF/BadG/BcrA/BcrD ATPase family protein [Eggerthellaceae bacterium]|nr:BadF/BadG/BcrA/BcrD ATPase family protein [Eggerthellaceae bacterium]
MVTGTTPHRLGIDAGSKTVKAVVLDEDDRVVFSTYRRHRADILHTLTDVLHDLNWRCGNLEATVAVTGSAGMQLAEHMGVPFVQEVVATTRAVQQALPHADAFIELGGEDAKVVYLTDGVEQRMNATCAGGTGGFIDTIAFMLGVRSAEMSRLANGARHVYPIASRCAVFAQTDVRPLLNAGASKADIAASAFDAVVRQTLGGLACGRPIRGTVAFLGGPLEHMPYLVQRFRKALGLDAKSGVKPRDAHLFTARGAALLSTRADNAGNAPRPCATAELERRIRSIDALEDDLEHLPPLFESPREIEDFRARHAQHAFPKTRLFDAKGALYLGIDAGSTTCKLAVLDEQLTLVHSAYEPVRGDVLGTLQRMLAEFYAAMPRPYYTHQKPYVHVAHACATGYGEDLLRAAFGVDSGVVETAAHLRAAQHLCPEATFVLDIGGQDMKALWVRDGQVADAVLNEACSSGCGAFIEGTSYSLRSNPWQFAERALQAKSPVDLGTKCTVFMTSRVRHAQKVGASLDDIAAGVAYSVVKNALYRIIGAERVASMGEHVVVQGGTFKSDAVLRAFEKVSGREVVRFEQSHLMGAIGAALIGAERARSSGQAESTLIGREALDAFSAKRRSVACGECPNACALSVVEFGDGRAFVTGNKCAKGAGAHARMGAGTGAGAGAKAEGQRAERPAPNVVAFESALLATFGDVAQTGTRGKVRVGLMNTLEAYAYTPFWHTLLADLGFSVLVPDKGCEQSCESAAWETLPSESVCYPAKTTHVRAFNLQAKGAHAVLMPRFARNTHCPVSCSYANALIDNLPPDFPQVVAPLLANYKPERFAEDAASRAELLRALDALASRAGAPLAASELDRALAAGLKAQEAFQQAVEGAAQKALAWIAASEHRHGILLAGRPYHVDPALLHGIDEELSRLGFAVLGVTGVANEARRVRRLLRETQLTTQEKYPWKPAKRLVGAALWVAQNTQVDLVCIQSFGCGFDAVSVEDVRAVLERAHRPFTTLKIDDIVDTAHIRIRLRTLAEAIESRKRREKANTGARNEKEGKGGTGDFGAAADAGISVERSLVVEPLAAPLGADDLDAARRDGIKDVCFTANVMASRAITCLRENPRATAVRLPRVCETCLTDVIPHMVERATGLTPAFIWDDATKWHAARSTEGHCAKPAPTPLQPQRDRSCCNRPRVGLVGNALLCFDPYMNDNIASKLASLGCELVLPDPALVDTDDVRYLPQLKAFDDAGVRDVVYLQSFGCLKGHVQARGALHSLRRRFPDLNITVIDYDPEASALNRENRLRLAVEAARERAKG